MGKAKRNADSAEHVLERLKLGTQKSDAEHEADAQAIVAHALSQARARGAAPLAVAMAAAQLIKNAHDATLVEPETLGGFVEALLTAEIEADDAEAEDPGDEE